MSNFISYFDMFGDDFGKYPFNVEGYTFYDLLRVLLYWKLPDTDLKQRLVLMLRKKRRYRHDAVLYEKACSEIDAIKWEELQHFRTSKRNWIGQHAKSNLEDESDDETDQLAEQKIILERLENKIEELKTFNEQSQKENRHSRNSVLLILIVIILLLSLQNYYKFL